MIFFRISSWQVVCACLFLAACDAASERAGPVFDEAWIRPLPPGMKMTAGFGTISNPGKKPIIFNKFESSSFGEVSLHRTMMVDGVSKMREVDELPVAPGESAVLEPGGYHLMLMMPKERYTEGQQLDMTLKLDNGENQTITFPVKKGDAMMMHHHHHNH